MKCCFCHQDDGDSCNAYAVYLCPCCLGQLLRTSPDDRTYHWYVSAMKRAIHA